MAGLSAMPAFMPNEWMYRINFLGLVVASDVFDSGDVEAVDVRAAS